MTVYFDKANYINYLKNSDNSDIFKDTLRMIKNQLQIHLNFDLEELDEYEFILHEEFEDGVSVDFRITEGEDRITRPLNKNGFPLKNGIYLLNENIEGIQKLHTILIGSLNDEIETLKKLIISEDYQFHKEVNIGVEITPNNPLNILDLPFSTLVIIDRYMFKGPAIGGNLGLFDFNLDKILKSILSKKNGDARIVLVYQINVNVAITNPLYDLGPDIKLLSKKIKNLVIKHCPAPELIFVGVPAGYIRDEHDRYILSNYLKIKSGDSFVYFDSLGKIRTNSNTVDFYSLGNRQNRTSNNQLIDKINLIAKEVLENHSKYSKVPEEVNVQQILNFKQ